jgi:DNA-binding transcriptional ArsR family regulator
MIRFRFPPNTAEAVAFAYSPLLEAVLSLHVLVEPKHHPLQHAWVRRMRRLSPALKREIASFAFAYRGFVPEFLMPNPSTAYAEFDAEAEALDRLDDETIALGFLRPLWDHRGLRDAALLADAEVRTGALANVRRLGGDDKLAELLFDRPRDLLRRFRRLVTTYWKSAFDDEWERLEPRLAEAVSDAGRRIAGEGVFAYLRGLSPQLLIDARRREVRRDLPHEHTVDVGPGSELVLIPSAFVWPHVRVNCDAPWPPGIVYPAPFVVEEGRSPLPPDDLVHVLRALGDETRLRALKLIAAKPRSTQELAPLVGISEAGLSKHLRALARAGLVQSRREGYYVLYSLDADRVAPLSEALLRFLSG